MAHPFDRASDNTSPTHPTGPSQAPPVVAGGAAATCTAPPPCPGQKSPGGRVPPSLDSSHLSDSVHLSRPKEGGGDSGGHSGAVRRRRAGPRRAARSGGGSRRRQRRVSDGCKCCRKA
eukprot:gene987-biopygen21228